MSDKPLPFSNGLQLKSMGAVLLLVLGVVATGSLSLFLLNRTLIQSVDNNLQSSISEMLSLAQHELAGDEDAITSSTYIPVEYAVEIRDASLGAFYRSMTPPERHDGP